MEALVWLLKTLCGSQEDPDQGELDLKVKDKTCGERAFLKV